MIYMHLIIKYYIEYSSIFMHEWNNATMET